MNIAAIDHSYTNSRAEKAAGAAERLNNVLAFRVQNGNTNKMREENVLPTVVVHFRVQ